MSTPPTRTTARTPLSVQDVLRREWYLFRFSWTMQDYPTRAYRRIKHDLRADLATAAADVGMPQALRDLGQPVVLAESYIGELGRRLSRYTTGIVLAGVAVGAVIYLGLAYSAGMLDAIGAMGGGSVSIAPLGTPMTFTHTDDAFSVEGELGWQWLVLYAVVAAVVFLLGSRLWRVRR